MSFFAPQIRYLQEEHRAGKNLAQKAGSKTVHPKQTEQQQEAVQQIPLTELHPFPDYPFQARDDDAMQETAESIKIYGVLVPAIVRPREDGGYEIISGHRRKHTCELVRLKTTPVIVRDMDRDAATIIMVDNNLQRENILPSERAKAYKMRLETIRRKTGQAAKTVENSLEQNGDQVGHHF